MKCRPTARPSASLRSALVACLLLLGGCVQFVARPTSGPCVTPDTRQWLAKAATSLTIHDVQVGQRYDTDAIGRAVPLGHGQPTVGARAVISYPEPDKFWGGGADLRQLGERSFVYDQALALLWATSRGDHSAASSLAQSLVDLQNPDGAWGFSFTAAGDGFYNAGYVRTGAVAWVLYALSTLALAKPDPPLEATIDRALRWLLARQDPQTGLVQAGRGRWWPTGAFEPDWPASFAATEHQFDAWFALQTLRQQPRYAQDAALSAAIAQLEAGIDAWLWLPDQQRYAQGFANGKADLVSALDAAGTWAALYDIARGRPVRARQSLAWVESHHGIDVHGWPGLQPYVPGQPQTWFVEGSLARALAWQRLGEPDRAHQALLPIVQLACTAGVPLVYAPTWAPDFPLTPAAAPTLWFLFVGRELAGDSPFLWTGRRWP